METCGDEKGSGEKEDRGKGDGKEKETDLFFFIFSRPTLLPVFNAEPDNGFYLVCKALRSSKLPPLHSLPDVLTRAETHRLLGAVYTLRYRVFFVTLYSTGLRLSEGLALEVGDIDRHRLRIHVRGG